MVLKSNGDGVRDRGLAVAEGEGRVAVEWGHLRDGRERRHGGEFHLWC